MALSSAAGSARWGTLEVKLGGQRPGTGLGGHSETWMAPLTWPPALHRLLA